LIAELEQSCVAEVGDKNRSYLVISDTHSCPLFVYSRDLEYLHTYCSDLYC
jgi:hypothetical protein